MFDLVLQPYCKKSIFAIMEAGQLKKILKDYSLRITDCRMDVLHYFSHQTHALSSRNLEERFPTYDRVTLFRTLNSFLEKGLIHKIPSDSGAANYALSIHDAHSEAHQHDHVHFTCDSCGNIECIDSAKVPAIEIPGYLIKEYNYLVRGTCKNCITK